MTRQAGAAVRIYRPGKLPWEVAGDGYFTVFIDRKERGELWTNQVRTFEVAPGQHELQLGTGWGWLFRSQRLSFEVGVGETADFACRRFWSSRGWSSLRPATKKDLAAIAKLTPKPPTPRNLGRDPFGCDYCAWDGNRLYGHVPEVASREGRLFILVQCHVCGAIYEQNEDGSVDRRLSTEEADLLYPAWRRRASN